MVVGAQDLLYLSPLSWEWAMRVYAKCQAEAKWAGHSEDWWKAGWCVWKVDGKGRELETEGRKFMIWEGQAEHQG